MESQKDKCGKFVLSLDFEQLWGVFDHETKLTYHENIIGGRKAIPKILELFDKYNIHASWGVVALLLAETKRDAIEYSPDLKPSYCNDKLSAYKTFDDLGENEKEDPYHFAGSLVKEIMTHDNQELCSHTFSHYYCKADGQNVDEFRADLQAAVKITEDKMSFAPKSIILPRNNYREDYARAVAECGFTAIRGNQNLYSENNSTYIARLIRMIDTYVNVCGKKCYDESEIFNGTICNIKASRFFRPYNPKLKALEKLKISCIKRQMKYAAKNNKVFHIWWHPHNFGRYPDKCLRQIEELFEYYSYLNKRYGFKSVNMQELSSELNKYCFIGETK